MPRIRSAELDLFLGPCNAEVDALHEATALYTRDPIVEQVLELANWPSCGGRFLDPGAGDGTFVAAAVRRLNPLPNDVGGLTTRVQAWEIHPHAAQAARERVSAVLLRLGWARTMAEHAAAGIVVEGDLLSAPHPGPFTLIAGNPPYLRFGNLPPGFKARYTELVPAYARSDLLYAFLDHCAELLDADGRLALVTADRWLFNEGAAALRERIGARLGIHALHRVDASSAFYRPKRRRAGTPPRVHPIVVLLAPAHSAARRLNRTPIHPDVTAEAEEGVVRLGEVATIRLAPWLGPHGVFTVDQRDALHLPPDALVPCVDTDDICPAGSLRTASRVAIRTDRETEPPPAVLTHLLGQIHRLPPRARRVPTWCPAESWGPFPLATEALLIPRIARGLRAVRLPAGILPINHNLTVVGASPKHLDALITALQSETCQKWIRERAPRLENGYYSITTRLLRQLPVQIGVD